MAFVPVFASRLDRRVSLYHEGNQNIWQGKFHHVQYKLMGEYFLLLAFSPKLEMSIKQTLFMQFSLQFISTASGHSCVIVIAIGVQRFSKTNPQKLGFSFY